MWNVSEAFKQTLRTEHQFATKIVLLDTDFKDIVGGTIFSADRTNEITNFISDGNIDVDVERGTRRTCELTMLNPTAEFTPATEDFKPEGPWVGKIYLNRIVRVYRGIYVGGEPEYVPVGTFMIDRANVIAERNMSLVNLTMSDLWKKLSKSYASHAYNFAKTTSYNAIITTLINDAGAAYPLTPVIDPLTARSAGDKITDKIITLEEGDSRGDFLKELAATWDIDMYFDPMGRFRTEDRRAARDKAVVWHFYSSAQRDGMLVSVNREFNDDNLYNHVVVIGGTDKVAVRKERADTDPRSKTNIALIGDRVWMIKDDKIKNATQATEALNRAWALRFQLGETIQCETISNPALEGDDVIRITDKTWAKVDGEYRLRRFTVPLVSSRQDVQAANIIYESDL